MAISLQPNAPQFTIDGVNYAISGNIYGGIMTLYEVGLLRWDGSAWLRAGNIFQVPDNGEGSIMAVVTQYGGIAGLLAQMKTNLRNLFASTFPGTQPPVGEPTTDAQAWAAIQAFVAGLQIDATKRPPTVA